MGLLRTQKVFVFLNVPIVHYVLTNVLVNGVTYTKTIQTYMQKVLRLRKRLVTLSEAPGRDTGLPT